MNTGTVRETTSGDLEVVDEDGNELFVTTKHSCAARRKYHHPDVEGHSPGDEIEPAPLCDVTSHTENGWRFQRPDQLSWSLGECSHCADPNYKSEYSAHRPERECPFCGEGGILDLPQHFRGGYCSGVASDR